MQVPFLDLKAQHAALEGELTEAFRAIVRGAAFVGGPEVEAFEREFAAFCQARGAVGVGSGTDALRFAYLAKRAQKVGIIGYDNLVILQRFILHLFPDLERSLIKLCRFGVIAA